MIRFCESFGLVGSGGTSTDQYVLAKWTNWTAPSTVGNPSQNPSDYLVAGAGPIGQTCYEKIANSGSGGMAKTIPVLPEQTSVIAGAYMRARDSNFGSNGILSIKATLPNYEFVDRENVSSGLMPAAGFSVVSCDLKIDAHYAATLTLGGGRSLFFIFNQYAFTTGSPIPAGTIIQNKWHFVEMKLDWSSGAIAGSVNIWAPGNMNGLVADGVQTINPSTTTDTDGNVLGWRNPLQLSIGCYGIDFTGVYVLDNLPSHDGSTAATNFLGPVIIEGMPPIADGSRRDWTPDTGTSHFARVTPPQDGDLSYVSTASAGSVDTYKFQTTAVHEGKMAFPAKVIYGVAVNNFARKADNDLHQISGVCVSGAALASSLPSVGLATQYTVDLGTFEVDPATGLPWTNTTMDAAEFGVALVT